MRLALTLNSFSGKMKPMSNAARNLEDFYQAEQLAYAASERSSVDQFETRLVQAGRDRLAAIDAFTSHVLGISDPVIRWKTLRSASVTLDAWMKDDTDKDRVFREELQERKRSLKRLARQSKRLGAKENVNKCISLIKSMERVQSLSAPIIRRMVKARDKVKVAIKAAENEMPEGMPKRRPLTARKSDISFEDATSEVMERTAVVREYLAR